MISYRLIYLLFGLLLAKSIEFCLGDFFFLTSIARILQEVISIRNNHKEQSTLKSDVKQSIIFHFWNLENKTPAEGALECSNLQIRS